MQLYRRQIDLVILLRMRLITPDFVAAFPQRILNIHPSLLPAPGTQVADALPTVCQSHRLTVHFVDEGGYGTHYIAGSHSR